MKGCIFSLGIIDKKLIWPLLYTIIQITQSIISAYYPKNKRTSVNYLFADGLGESLIILIPYITWNKNRSQKREKNVQSQMYCIIFSYYYLMEFIMG